MEVTETGPADLDQSKQPSICGAEMDQEFNFDKGRRT